jgi:predicted nucleic acid-binding protein
VIYFDTAYILKCYLPEPHCQLVRQLLAQHRTAACCILGKLEFAAGVHRALREGKLTSADAQLVFQTMRQDDAQGVWTWLPLTPQLVQRVVDAFETLPPQVFLRTGDAVHLACAEGNGLSDIYSNDQHLLAAASLFGLVGKNVLP